MEIRGKITSVSKLKLYEEELANLEREITLFQAEAALKTLEISKSKVDLIGFHGQTIFHDPENKITKQLGDGKLLSQLTKKKVVYDFRQNDLKNGGQGAPLAPIFHNVMANKISKKFDLKCKAKKFIDETKEFQNKGLEKSKSQIKSNNPIGIGNKISIYF